MLEAVKAGDVAQVKALIEADPALVNAKDEAGNSAILLATYYGRRDVVNVLLAHDAELSLFEASAVGRLDRVQALVAEDPDLTSELVNAYSHDGFTPLGLASFFGHRDVAEFLLAHGAEINAASKNKMRVMPLHSAVASRHFGIAEILLAHGADVNAAQQDGYTPLHEAAQNGQVEMAELLLAHGANIDARKDDGQTSLAVAMEHSHMGAADLLRRHGATESALDTTA
jgi:ankyrin repeat protein